MSRYPETEEPNSTGIADPGSTVVDLASYRRRRGTGRGDANADGKLRNKGAETAGSRNAPAEDHRQD